MIRIPSGSIGVCQGLHEMFSDFADGGVMWTGEGDRERRHVVTFDAAFLLPPVVHLSLTMWDMDHQTNARVDLVAETVTEVGFHLVVRTWGDTKIARIRASWLAIGQVLTDDDWVVG